MLVYVNNISKLYFILLLAVINSMITNDAVESAYTTVTFLEEIVLEIFQSKCRFFGENTKRRWVALG
jgi:hypothetical protein